MGLARYLLCVYYTIIVSPLSIINLLCYGEAMDKGFWGKLKKPIMVLAPMADVTDAAFRKIIAKYGKPDVFVTEFTSADGLCSAGKEHLLLNFKFSKEERPIIAQLFGAHPDKMFEAARLVRELGFDGLDINMGCPDRSVVKQGSGGALIKTPKLAQEILRAAQEGAKGIPVSVKTRLGFSKDELDTWLPILLECNPAAVTIHARTVKEMSLVPARWQRVHDAIAIRNALKSETLILGNGDALDVADAKKKAKASGADGVMLGRAIFGNPWLFSNSQEFENELEGEMIKRKLTVLLEHVKLFDTYFRGKKNFAIMKKHFKAYISGFDNAKEFRITLMEAKDEKEVKSILQKGIKTLI